MIKFYVSECSVLLFHQQSNILFTKIFIEQIVLSRNLVTSSKHPSHQAATREISHTRIRGAQMVRVTGEERLVVLGREIHVIVGQRLSSRHPRVPARAPGRADMLEAVNQRLPNVKL